MTTEHLRRRLADVCPCVQFVRMRVQSEIEKFDDRTYLKRRISEVSALIYE
jgi:hypothetical protein